MKSPHIVAAKDARVHHATVSLVKFFDEEFALVPSLDVETQRAASVG
jgi:hypothetical protein